MKAVIRCEIPCKDRAVGGALCLPQAGCPAVLFCHGFGGSGADFEKAAARLAEGGIGSLRIDFNGGSNRAQQYLSTEQMTLGTQQEDLHAAIDYLLAQGVSPRKLFLFGGSQGGLAAALAAAQRPQDVRGLILLYPALCIPDDWNARFPSEEDIPARHTLWGVTLGKEYFVYARKLDVFSSIGKYAGPVLLMHGDADKVVPVEYSRRAARTYPQARLIEFAGEGHGFSPRADRTCTAYTEEFVEQCLRTPPDRS